MRPQKFCLRLKDRRGGQRLTAARLGIHRRIAWRRRATVTQRPLKRYNSPTTLSGPWCLPEIFRVAVSPDSLLKHSLRLLRARLCRSREPAENRSISVDTRVAFSRRRTLEAVRCGRERLYRANSRDP